MKKWHRVLTAVSCVVCIPATMFFLRSWLYELSIKDRSGYAIVMIIIIGAGYLFLRALDNLVLVIHDTFCRRRHKGED